MGNGYVVAVQLLSVPFLLRLLGSEAYGLVALQVTFLALFTIFDFGISPSLTRMLAVHSTGENAKALQKDSLQTLEIISISINLAIAIVFYFLAPVIAKHWINLGSMNTHTATLCLQLIGIQCAIQSVTNFYLAGLIGLQKMVASNGLLMMNQTLRTVSGFGCLLLVSTSIISYFVSQVIFSLLGLLITMIYIHQLFQHNEAHSGPQTFGSLGQRFSKNRFNECKHYAKNLAMTSILGFLIFQTDKILVSKLVSLQSFSYYSILANFGFIIAGAAGLIAKAATPRMTQLVELKNFSELKVVYLRSSAFTGWLVLATSGMLIFFSDTFLSLYLHSSYVSTEIRLVFILLILAYAICSLSCMPYALSLSYGWGKYGVNLTLAGLCVSLPAVTFLTFKYGVVGAATAFFIFALVYAPLSILSLHSKYLKSELNTIIKTLALPLAFTVVAALITIMQAVSERGF